VSTVAFFSAKGAPGTTTAAMLVASLWPRPALLVDADAAGGDIALRLPAPDGRPLDQSTGMLSLLPLARRAITGDQVLTHAQRVLGGGEVIAGLSGPEQATAAGPVWAALIDVLGAVAGRDMMIDLGRLSANSAVLPMAARADVAVLIARDTVSGVFAARARLHTLVPALIDAHGGGPQLGLVVQGESDREADSAASVIRGEFPRVQFFGRLAWDVAGVRMFDGQHVSRPERSMIVRSGRDIVAALDGALYAVELLGTRPSEDADAVSVPTPDAARAASPPGGERTRPDERAARRALLGRRRGAPEESR
jgi:hypothetical protein